MAEVLVGLWSRPTKSKHDLNSDTVTHMMHAVMRTKVEAQSRIKHAGQLTSIFVAPEFLFTRPTKYRQGFHTSAVPKSFRDLLLAELRGIASSCPNMLMVPGTIVFKEDLTAESIQKAKDRLTHAINPGAKPWSKNAKFKTYNTWEALGDRYKHLSPSEGSVEVYNDAIKELSLAEQNIVNHHPPMIERSFLIKNRTYIFFGGCQVMSYGKKCNADDFKGEPEQGIFIPGRKAGVKQIAGLRVGVEICADHSAGMLKEYTQVADLDLQIICSAEVPNEIGNMRIKVGGYTLHASSEPAHTKVLKRVKGIEYVDQKPVGNMVVDDGNLLFYVIDI